MTKGYITSNYSRYRKSYSYQQWVFDICRAFWNGKSKQQNL